VLASELTNFVSRKLAIRGQLVGKQLVGDDVIHCTKNSFDDRTRRRRELRGTGSLQRASNCLNAGLIGTHFASIALAEGEIAQAGDLNDFADTRMISTLEIWCRRRRTMNTLTRSAIGFVVVGLLLLPAGLPTARAEDDWEDRWEDYQEELEDRREDERERYEEWLEDREEAIEEAREEGRVVVPHRVVVQERPVVVPERSVVVPERSVVVPKRSAVVPQNWRQRNRQTRYWQQEGQYEGQYEETLPPPRRYTQEERRYPQEEGYYREPREPVYDDEYRGEVYGGEVYYEEPPVYEYYSEPEYRYYGTSGFGYSEYGRQRSVRVGPVEVFWNR
jgi:hypothetical protein